jgi:hypothetical protein
MNTPTKREHPAQEGMLGHRVREAASATSRSGKVNDRMRRKYKRAEKFQLDKDIKAGLYRLAP